MPGNSILIVFPFLKYNPSISFCLQNQKEDTFCQNTQRISGTNWDKCGTVRPVR